jgi:hypothetical protein
VSNPPRVAELALAIDVVLGPAEIGSAFSVALGLGMKSVYVEFKIDSATKTLDRIGAIAMLMLEHSDERTGPEYKSGPGRSNAISHKSHTS